MEETLVGEGVITEADLQEIRAVAGAIKLPVFSQLVASGKCQRATKAIAVVAKVPYVNLTTAKVDPKVLDLLPQRWRNATWRFHLRDAKSAGSGHVGCRQHSGG